MTFEKLALLISSSLPISSRMAQLLASRLGDLNDAIKDIGYSNLAKYAVIGTSSLGVSYALTKKLLLVLEKKKLKKLRDEQTTAAKLATIEWASDAAARISDLKLDAESITSLSYNELKEALKSKKLTATTVLTAFQYVATKQNAKYNFITEPVPNAIELAESLDQCSDSERQSLPLFGIPVSIKEHFDVAGLYSTCGLSYLLQEKSPVDSSAVQALRKLGAIPFIRTNVPQSLMTLGCHNPIYGETKNPLDETRAPGGSSGGESAALACGASILGLGSDIAGSIRVPAAWTGTVGLKPTCGRFGAGGITGPFIGQNIVHPTSGYMAREVSALVDGHRYFSSAAQYVFEPTLPPVQFDEEMLSSTKPLTIAYCSHIDPIHTTESTKIAIQNIANRLRKQGHTVIAWDMPRTLNPWKVNLNALYGDAGQQLLEKFVVDDVSYLMTPFVAFFCLPQRLKKMIISFIKPFIPSFVHDFYTALCGVASVNDWWKLQGAALKHRGEVIEDWQSKAIDVLLCPAVPCPAPKLGTASAYIGLTYAWPFNLCNFPAGVVPVAKLIPADVCRDLEHCKGSDIFHSAVRQAIPGSEGLPISVQVVCLPYHDEQCLRVMKQIESFGSWKNTTLTSM